MPAITQVRFYLDGDLFSTENNPPYDFNGGTSGTPNPWDTSSLADGDHTISAEVDLDDGTTETVSATFTISNGVVDPPPPPSGSGNIDWTTTATTGSYATNGKWVVGPAQITAITPGWDGSLNGSMINPTYQSDQGYDARRWYDANLNDGLSLPITLQPGESLCTADCWVLGEAGAPTAQTFSGIPRPALKESDVLHCVTSQPAANAFRPGYGDGAKREFTLDDLIDLATLPNFSLPSGYTADAIADAAIANISKPYVDHKEVWEGRWMRASDNMEDYSRDIATDINLAACVLCCNVSLSKKQDLAKYLCQIGIDYFSVTEPNGILGHGGFPWAHDGGIGSGRKLPIILAGYLLNDATMRDYYSDGKIIHLEDAQTFYLTGSETNYASHYQSVWGQTIGDASWGEEHSGNGDGVAVDPGNLNYFKCCTANAWLGSAFVGRALALEPYWNHNAFFDYMDWYMDFAGGYPPTNPDFANWQVSNSQFIGRLWQQERANL